MGWGKWLIVQDGELLSLEGRGREEKTPQISYKILSSLQTAFICRYFKTSGLAQTLNHGSISNFGSRLRPGDLTIQDCQLLQFSKTRGRYSPSFPLILRQEHIQFYFCFTLRLMSKKQRISKIYRNAKLSTNEFLVDFILQPVEYFDYTFLTLAC